MDELPEDDKPGVPAWVVTFADLMSLLMCFFVLLLSFSEIDANKFKQIADELSKAFGVQREVPALEVPMGTTPVFDKFSAGKPEPTVLDEVRQQTSEQKPNLQTNTTQSDVEARVEAQLAQTVEKRYRDLKQVLQEEMAQDRVHLKKANDRIIIRIEEKGSFPSGSAKLTWAFEGLLIRVAKVLEDMPGKLTIEGHTDDLPIRSDRYDSNWNLSADRAAAVANVLLEASNIEPTRVRVQGFADTRPRVPNSNAENRALNRRVEIIIDLSQSLHEERIRLLELMDESPDELHKDYEAGAGKPIDEELSW
ncbi:flagellar motor protein MotB [Marinobacteraceae bacterium S3BR75-40.1]